MSKVKILSFIFLTKLKRLIQLTHKKCENEILSYTTRESFNKLDNETMLISITLSKTTKKEKLFFTHSDL